MRQCHAGQDRRWDGIDFRVLRPPASVTIHGNDAGCVVLVTRAGGHLLLPADTSSKVEPGIAGAIPPGPPLVLVVPHHGTKTSSSAAYLEALRPRIAVVSTGYLNGFHHPAPSIVARYATLRIPLSNTTATGAVRLCFPAGRSTYILAEERRRQARYWRETASKGSTASR